MSLKYTPGSWKARGSSVWCERDGSNGEFIVATASGRLSVAENEANARLVAAAPDLLTALNHLQATPNDPRMHRMALDAIAIAKATGQQAGV